MTQRPQMKEATATLVGRRLPPSRRPGVLARQGGVLSAKNAKKREEEQGARFAGRVSVLRECTTPKLQVGRRLPPSRLGAFGNRNTPRRQSLKAYNRAGFPRESFRVGADFQAARQEPSHYLLCLLRASSCSSRMNPGALPSGPQHVGRHMGLGDLLKASLRSRPLRPGRPRSHAGLHFSYKPLTHPPRGSGTLISQLP